MPTLPAILLAAGLSSRMGAFKPLLSLHNLPLLHHVLRALDSSGVISEILLITGHRADEIRASLLQYKTNKSIPATLPVPLNILHNPGYADGEMLSSLLTALPHLSPAAPAFLLALADHPAVLPDTITRLATTFFQQNPALQSPAFPIVVPTHTGKRGHPVILSTTLVPEIRSLSPGESLKTVVHRHLAHAFALPVDDPAILLDLDTPADVARAQALVSPSTTVVPPAHL